MILQIICRYKRIFQWWNDPWSYRIFRVDRTILLIKKKKTFLKRIKRYIRKIYIRRSFWGKNPITFRHSLIRTWQQLPRIYTPWFDSRDRNIGDRCLRGAGVAQCTRANQPPTAPPFKTIIYLKNARASQAFIPEWRGLLVQGVQRVLQSRSGIIDRTIGDNVNDPFCFTVATNFFFFVARGNKRVFNRWILYIL